MDDTLGLPPFDVVTAKRDAFIIRLVSFVAATIVVYDWVITFDREIELIWKKRWSAVKVVYLWHRYFGIAVILLQAVVHVLPNVTDEFCQFWFYWESWCYTFLAFSSETILILWTWVIYNQNKRLLSICIFAFVCEIAAVVTIEVLGLRQIDATASFIPGDRFCIQLNFTDLYRNLWLPVVGFYAFMSCVFLVRGYQVYILRSSAERFGVLSTVTNHTIVNYLAMNTAFFVCAIMWIHVEHGLARVPVSFAIALSLTDCARLLVNVRRGYYASEYRSVEVDNPWNLVHVLENCKRRARRSRPSSSRPSRQQDSFGNDLQSVGRSMQSEMAVAVQVEVTQDVAEGDAFEMRKMRRGRV